MGKFVLKLGKFCVCVRVCVCACVLYPKFVCVAYVCVCVLCGFAYTSC